MSFLDASWSVAKTCQGITDFARNVSFNKRSYRDGSNYTPPNGVHKTDVSTVDIVAENGLDWIKVCQLSEGSLLREIFKSGWTEDSDDAISDDEQLDQELGLLKTMRCIVQASRRERVRCRHPAVRLVLLNISRNTQEQAVAQCLKSIRALGVIVQTAEDFPSSPLNLTQEVLDRMTADQFHTFTSQLNIDPSLLIAFASDISNRELAPQDWHCDNMSDQIKLEMGLKVSDLLPVSRTPANHDSKRSQTANISLLAY